MKLFTIGFTKKTAEQFMNLLKDNHVRTVIDIRLNNSSQLAGFAKGTDLKFFLKTIAGIDYKYYPNLAPPRELLKDYQNGKIGWSEYVPQYLSMLKDNDILNTIDIHKFENACLLCSESLPDQCHRRLLAEYLQSHYQGIEIIHL